MYIPLANEELEKAWKENAKLREDNLELLRKLDKAHINWEEIKKMAVSGMEPYGLIYKRMMELEKL